MADYSQIEREQIKKNKQYGEQQAQSMRENANSWINELNSAIDAASKPVIEGMENSKGDVANQYKSVYDANAVQELVNRRQVQETMANMGLTDSGLNRTQQTAIALQRGNADASARMQEQAALDKITQSINEYLAQIASQKQQNSANILGQTNSSISSLEQSLYQNALNNAASQYQAQIEAAANADKQMWERIQAVMSHNLDVDKLRAQYGEGGTYYAIDDNGNIVTSTVNPYASSGSGVESGSGGGGVSGSANSDLLPAERRTYTKIKDTPNWFWGTDNDDVVQDQYGNSFRIDSLPESLHSELTKLKEGESYTGEGSPEDTTFVQDLTEVDPTLLIKNVPTGDWSDSEIAEINEKVGDAGAAVFNVSPQERRDKMDKEIVRRYLQMRDGYVEYRDDPRFNRGYNKSAILSSLKMMNSHAPKQYDFTSGEMEYISDMIMAMLDQAYKKAH